MMMMVVPHRHMRSIPTWCLLAHVRRGTVRTTPAAAAATRRRARRCSAHGCWCVRGVGRGVPPTDWCRVLGRVGCMLRDGMVGMRRRTPTYVPLAAFARRRSRPG